jgi:hypothetical protein
MALSRLKEALEAAADNAEATERAFRGIELAIAALEKIEKDGLEARHEQQLDNVEDRQKEVFAQPPPTPIQEPQPPVGATAEKSEKPEKPEPEPDEDARPARPASQPAQRPAPTTATVPAPRESVTVYGITLGSNIDEALEALKKNGYPTDGAPFLKSGRMYHSVQGLPAVLPNSLLENAVSACFYLAAYNDAVLSVIVQLDYNRSRSFDDLKNALWQAFPELTGSHDSRGVKISDNIFSYELGVSLPNHHGTWMYATDKANGTCRLEIEHVDLVNLSYYWSAGGK